MPTLARRRFRIMKEIAEGGFGKVYLAEMISGDFSTVVALKLLHGKWSDNLEIVSRSRDEARVLGRLRHPNIVRVDDLTSINGQCAVVMEYVDGVNLKVLLKWLERDGAAFPPKAAFEVIADVADALDAAYNTVPLQESQPLHLVHRDVKPSNIMIAPTGHVKLLDFGTAQARFDSRESKTQAMTFGSKGYMSPERMMQEGDTPAGDIFSLGVMLYWMLSGQQLGEFPLRPSKYDRFLEARLATINPSRLGPPELHDDIRSVLRVMLAHDPEARPGATQVMELCEILGDSAGGRSLRSFCRGTVPPILAAWQAHTDGKADALVGSILHEDRTSSMPYDPAAEAGARRTLELPAPSLHTFATELPEVDSGARPLALHGRRRRRPPISEEELRALPLSAKLKQDVSLRTIKSVFTHEITLGGKKKRPPEPAAISPHLGDAPTDPTLAEDSGVAALLAADPDEADSPRAREAQSLAEKLKQEVSIKSLKSVLTHELRFGRRKK